MSPDGRAALRSEFRARRQSVPPAARRARSLRAQRHLSALPRIQQTRRLALYRAFDGEVATEWLETWAGVRGIQVVFPRHRRGHPLIFVQPEQWETTRSGCPLPCGPAVALDVDDVVVVPGVAFDRTGHRLGLGGGHYDRTLAQSSAWPVGLAFECQCVDSVPRAAWDRPVRALCTETNTYLFEPMESNA